MSSYQIIDSGVRPDICIAMLAYNHEAYIAQAIESVLMQQTSYQYKIIVAEDCSTDNTRQILLDYQKKYPDKFKLILQDKNVGVSKNNRDLLSNIEGRYVAALEGDDYWTDPDKLQKQVTFLEEHQEYVLCGTEMKVLFNDRMQEPTQAAQFRKFDFYDIVWGNPIPTLTLCFRNIPLDYEMITKSIVGDSILLLELARNGGLGASLPFTSAVYRYHGSGANSGNGRYKNLFLQLEAKYKYGLPLKDEKFNKILKAKVWNLAVQECKLLLRLKTSVFDYRILKLCLSYYFKL